MFLFAKTSIGVDIADNTIESAQLVRRGKAVQVLSLSRVSLEPGIVKAGRIQDSKQLALSLKKLFREAKPLALKPKKIIFGLPENQVYFCSFELAPHSIRDRELLVLHKVQRAIPLEPDDILFSYKVLREKEKAIEILVTAASREVVEEWQKFFKSQNLETELFDIESLAVFRGLYVNPPQKTVLVADIGSQRTNLSIFDQTGIRYSHTFNLGGESLTQELSKTLKVSPEEAEKKKIVSGIKEQDSKVFLALVAGLEKIVKEIKEIIGYFQNKTQKTIEEAVLVGGTSNLKGIEEYFSANLELPVRVGISALLGSKAPLEYLEAIGLALRDLSQRWKENDLAIYPLIQTKKVKALEGAAIRADFLDLSKKQKTEKRISGFLLKKILILAAILVFGLLAVFLGLVYSKHYKSILEQQRKEKVLQFIQTQKIMFKIPVAVSQSEYNIDRVKGRIIEKVIASAGDYQEAVNISRIEAQKMLTEGEKLWKESINKSAADQKPLFPAVIKWLAFIEEDVKTLFLKEVDKLNTKKISYAFNIIEYLNVESIENSNVFLIVCEGSLSLNEPIEQTPTAQIQGNGDEQGVSTTTNNNNTNGTSSPAVKPMILITETETGWLNVRQGPGTNYAVKTKVYPGESYPLLEELTGWYKIKMKDGSSGWVLSKYAVKQ